MHKKSFWPYGILLSILAIVVSCVLTIVIAVKNPVYEDNYYFDSYQHVDENYNEIQEKQKIFDKRYKIKVLFKDVKFNKNKTIYILKAGENNSFILKIKTDYPLKQLKLKALLSRPHTTADDMKPKYEWDNNKLIIKLNPDKKGLWQLLLKFEDEKSVGFYRFYLEAR